VNPVKLSEHNHDVNEDDGEADRHQNGVVQNRFSGDI
jgi:hypothetical protein